MKTSKKALLTSVVALVVCFSLLIGSTFAWFTDSVTSGVNTITAGNLDIEVDYLDGNGAWQSLQDSDSLFSGNLWEPGHTEVVYLRVTNAGSLGLKYKVLVTPVNEKGGVNVDGDSFKLSDYMVFATTNPTDTQPSFTREEARREAGSTTGLADVNNLTQASTMQAGQTQYLALVVYMPESVGNVANYKTGTEAPTIELGIQVVATQLQGEFDSFGPDYDKDAEFDPVYTVGAYYNYFPQVSVSAPVVVTDDNKVSTYVAFDATDANGNSMASVNVPAGVALVAGTEELTLAVVPAEAGAATEAGLVAAGETAANGRETANFDIKVEGVDNVNNAVNIAFDVFIGKGLANVKLYHNGSEVFSQYDATTGYVRFKTATFSDFTAAYDVAAAAIDGQTYGSLKLAMDAVQPGQTIKLLKNAEGNGIRVAENGELTIDFNGFTYNVTGDLVGSTGTVSQAAQLLKGATVVFKNGTLTSTKAKMMIQNYSNLTLVNMTVDGTSASCDYVLSTNCGNVAIKGNTNLLAAEGKVALDVMHWENADYKEAGTHVVIDETMTGKVVGAIEVYCYREREVVAVDDNGATLTIKAGAFTDLADAIEYAQSGATIKLAADAQGAGLASADGAQVRDSLTIDFNGYTYTMSDPAVGSKGTQTQAMHWGKSLGSVTMKNGTFKVAKGAENVKMAMQNYVAFTAENMVFDFTAVPVVRYGQNEFSGQYEKYNGRECPMFNNNSGKEMVLTNTTIYMPAESEYGVIAGASMKLTNSTINGSVVFEEAGQSVTLVNSTISKGVVAYFKDELAVVETENGFAAAAVEK